MLNEGLKDSKVVKCCADAAQNTVGDLVTVLLFIVLLKRETFIVQVL